jgi:hypothetical protein
MARRRLPPSRSRGPAHAAASNADSPSKDPSSEKKISASPPSRMDSTDNMDLTTDESVDISAKNFKGKGFNPSLYEAIKKCADLVEIKPNQSINLLLFCMYRIRTSLQ